jgi:hypothetical protein
MIIYSLVGLLVIGGVIGYVRLERCIIEIHDQVNLIDLKIEGQIKPQVERHHTAIRIVDENMHRLVNAVK